MNDSITFGITFSTENEAEKALTIMKDMAMEDSSYNGWLDYWKSELFIDGFQITVDDDTFYGDQNHDEFEFVQLIFTAIVKQLRQQMSGTVYNGFALYSDPRCAYQEYYEFNQETAKMVVSENGFGCCDDCDEVVVYIDEYDPNKDYYCPICGKLFDHDELFLGERPTVQYF